MSYLNCCIIFCLCCGYSMGEMMLKTAENYGPFVPRWNDYGACKAPKAVNLTNFTTHLLVENNTYQGVMNFTFLTLAVVEEDELAITYKECIHETRKQDMINIQSTLMYTSTIEDVYHCNKKKLKIIVYSVKAGRKSLLWNYRVDKPCQHYAIAEILDKQFGVKDCTIRKGNHYWVINFTECTYKFLGTSFFYGEFVFKLIVWSKKGNIACMFYNPVFMKKT